MKFTTHISAAPLRINPASEKKLRTIKTVDREASLRDVADMAAPGISFGEAYETGLQHGLKVAYRDILAQGQKAGGLTTPQLKAARLLRVTMVTQHPAAATAAPLPRSTGWVRVGAALGVSEGKYLSVWTWAIPASLDARPKAPTRSATPSDDEWQDER